MGGLMTCTLDEMRREIRQCLENADIANAVNQTRWLINARTGYSPGDIIARPETELDSEIVARLKRDCRELKNGKPLSRVLGTDEFYGLTFGLNAATLAPRPDTEILVDAIRAWRRNHPYYCRNGLQFIDLGTGSGCILISLLHYWPDCFGIGTDIDEYALKQAADNAVTNRVESRTNFVCSNWFDGLGGRYPLLVANPPYIQKRDIESLDESVQRFDPYRALDGGDDGLCSIKRLVNSVIHHLTEDGSAFFEIGYNQLHDVSRLIDKADLNLAGVHYDLGGIPRVVEICYGDNSKKN